jgi:hypothetical protein
LLEQSPLTGQQTLSLGSLIELGCIYSLPKYQSLEKTFQIFLSLRRFNGIYGFARYDK